jgi:spore coat protein CotH
MPGYCDLKTPDAFGEVCDCFQQDEEGDDPDREHLKALCLAARGATAETWWADMSAHVDLDDFLRSVATEAVIQHFDGYAGNDNNFRLYREPSSGMWTWSAWSTDQAFGWVPWQDTFECGMARTEPKDFFWQSDMMRACWNAPGCKEHFYALVGEQLEVFEEMNVASWMQDERDRIAPLAEADPKQRYQPADQRTYTECLLGWAEQRGPWLEEWLESDARW